MRRREWFGLLFVCCSLLVGCPGSGGGGIVDDAGGGRDDTGGNDAAPDAEQDADEDAPGDVPGDAPEDTGADMGADTPDMGEPDVVEPPDEWPEGVRLIDLDGDGEALRMENFAGAEGLDDFAWATSAGVACWKPAQENVTGILFKQNHMAFALRETVPAWHDVTVSVTATTSQTAANVYLLAEGPRRRQTPPTVTDGFCRLSAKGIGQDNVVTFRTSAGPANIFFAVANEGRFRNDDEGEYEIHVTVKPVAERCYEDILGPGQWAPPVRRFGLDDEGKALFRGELADGAPLCNLESVNSAQVACFPSNKNDFFRGNHVLYALDHSFPENSILTVTVTPDPGVEVSLYGTREGTTFFESAPALSPGVCEASYTFGQGTVPNPGEAESIFFVATTNPFNLFFAVAGDEATGGEGGYTVTVELLHDDTAQCDQSEYIAYDSEYPEFVNLIDLDGDGFASVPGNLSAGAPLCGLDWASSGQTACFPDTRFGYFEGAHVMYALSELIPPRSVLEVTVIPDLDTDINLYGYRTGEQNLLVPPFVPVLSQCDAAYPSGIGVNPNPGEPETLTFINPSENRSYRYFFGVAGSTGVLEGNYEIQIRRTIAPPPHCEESLPGASYPIWPGNVNLVSLDGQGQAVVEGNLADGQCSALEWAQSGQVACFPSTRFNYFEGNQVFYALADPLPPRSEMNITVTPRPGVDVSLYGYQVGATSYPVPPAVTRTVSCEASYPLGGIFGETNPGEPESLWFANYHETSSYNIFWAVSGTDTDGETGAFTIEVEVAEEQTHCEESLPGQQYDAWPEQVTLIDLVDGAGGARGDLASGSCTNLDFAEDSQIACFPSTRFDYFTGNHVFYALADPLPGMSVATITVTPDPGVEVSLYGYRDGLTEFQVPPRLVGSAVCEASYPVAIGHQPNPGEPETIQFFSPNDNEYNIFFAVAGDAQTGLSGRFAVDVRVDTATPHCPESLPGRTWETWPSNVERVRLSNGRAALSGNLNEGSCLNLDWAQSGQVACFPETRFDLYTGNHVYYALNEPLPPRSEAIVRVQPRPGVDVNIYGYQVGPQRFPVPPAVSGVLTCEASYPRGVDPDPDPGVEEEIRFVNPSDDASYNIFFAVAGSGDDTAGAYDIEVEVNTTPVHCPESLPGRSYEEWPPEVEPIAINRMGVGSVQGQLSDGACVNLDWASNSSVACFPETRFNAYLGNHRWYTVSRPLPADKAARLTVTPSGNQDLSLYAYLLPTWGSRYLPPFIPQVGVCEAAYRRGAGEAETFDIWNRSGEHDILIGVAGAQGVDTAAFELSVEVIDAP